MFYLECQENKDTTSLVVDMAMTIAAPSILGECHDPKKALSDYVTSIDRQVSWGETTEEEYLA